MNEEYTFDSLPKIVAELHGKVNAIAKDILAIRESIANLSGLGQTLTVEQVAEMLGKSTSTIYGMTSKKMIPHYRPGNTLVFMRDEILDWIRSFPANGKPLRRKKSVAVEDEKSSFPNLNGNVVDVESNTIPETNLCEDSAKETLSETQNERNDKPFVIEERAHTRTNELLFAVLFSIDIDNRNPPRFKDSARQFGGYWSDFGNGGYIFKSRENAEKFAEHHACEND